MRQQRNQQSTPAPVFRSGTDLPTSGYALVVDGQVKREFEERARSRPESGQRPKAAFPDAPS